MPVMRTILTTTALFLLVILAGCGSESGDNAEAASTTTAAATTTSEAVAKPTPTKAPNTTQPPATMPTLTRQTASGTGSEVVQLDPPIGRDQVALIAMTHTGDSNFIVQAMNASGGMVDGLANAVGTYKGRRMVNAITYAADEISLVEIQADGAWTLEVQPLTDAGVLAVPGTFSGNGPDVVLMPMAQPRSGAVVMKISHTAGGRYGGGNFIVYSISDSAGQRLEVNEVGSVDTSVVLPQDVILVEVRAASGEWTLTVE